MAPFSINALTPPPPRLGGYRLERLLGRGGMGEVFLAWDERLARHVAIKRILRDPPPEACARARFRREARAVARLNHPAIVQVYDLLENGEEDCLVLEFVNGTGLSEVIAQGPMDVDLVLRLASEIASGLAEAHAHGLVHRDLKPGNILVTATGHASAGRASAGHASAGRAKILDFGLALLLWHDGEETLPPESLTRAGALLGTVHAMSPEQASGRTVDHRSDLFALGGLIYEMLGGRTPFGGFNVLDTLRRVISEEPVPLAERRPGLPRELVCLVSDLLEKNPLHRPQNAHLVMDSLDRLRTGCGPPPVPSPAADPSPPSPRAGANAVTDAPTGQWSPVAERGEKREPWRPEPGHSLPGRPLWTLEERLSTRGVGERWTAVHESGEKRLFTLAITAEDLPALKREVTFARLLTEALGRREDIAQVLDWNLDEVPFYLEEQYSEAGDVQSWAERRGGLAAVPLASRLELMAQVCDALAAVHAVDVVHGDLRPAVLLIADGKGEKILPRIMLSGFGAASPASSTETFGISRYAAPEVLEGAAPTAKSDLFAVGLILYQVVTGDFGRVLAPGWRREVDHLLAEEIAWSVDRLPARRPSTAAEIASRLRRLEARRAELKDRREAQTNRRALRRSHLRRRQLAGFSAGLVLLILVLAFQERRAAREAARANREQESAHEVAEFLVGLFEIADPAERQGRSLSAFDLLDRGRETLRYRLQGQPEMQAALSRTLGRVYANLGDYEAASPLLQDAVDRLAAPGQSSGTELAASMHELAKLHFARGDYGRAVQLYQEALTRRLEVLGAAHPDVAVNRNDLGLALVAAGDLAAANDELVRALEANRQRYGDEHRRVAAVQHNLARLREAEGDLEAAEGLQRQALDLQRRVLGQPHPDVAASLNNLGVLLFRRGDAAAEALLRQSLEQKREIFGAVHPEVAAGLNNLGVLLQDEGGGETSRRLYEQALSMYRELFGDAHVHVATTLVNLAVLEIRSDRTDRAEMRCREARAVFRRHLPNDAAAARYGEGALAPCAPLLDGPPTVTEPESP